MSDQPKPDEFPKALSMHDVRDGLTVGPDGRALLLEDQSGNGNHMAWAPGEGPLVTAGGGLVIDQPKPVAPEVDLDQATEDLWLLRNLSSGFADEPLERLAAIIAETRAHRAANPEREWEGGYAAGHSDARFAKWGTSPNPHSTTEVVLAKQAASKLPPVGVETGANAHDWDGYKAAVRTVLGVEVGMLAKVSAERDALTARVADLEAETMTLTSERDAARMTQDELRAELQRVYETNRDNAELLRVEQSSYELTKRMIAGMRAVVEAAQPTSEGRTRAAVAHRVPADDQLTDPCVGCGKRSSIFTTGCEHCDYELRAAAAPVAEPNMVLGGFGAPGYGWHRATKQDSSGSSGTGAGNHPATAPSTAPGSRDSDQPDEILKSAAPVAEPHEIRVGSTWRHVSGRLLKVRIVDISSVVTELSWWTREIFLQCHEWVSDPTAETKETT